jgi:hypothetical protein
MTIRIPDWVLIIFFIILFPLFLFHCVLSAHIEQDKKNYSSWRVVSVCEKCNETVDDNNQCCPHCGAYPLKANVMLYRKVYVNPWYSIAFETPKEEWKKPDN